MRDQLAGVLDQAAVYAAMVGMIVPPWNLFWWTVGGILRGLSKDSNGDGGIAAFCLPGLVAALPFYGAYSLVKRR